MKPLAITLFLLFVAVPSFSDSITMYNNNFFLGSPMVPGTDATAQLLYSERPDPWGPITQIDFTALVDTTQFSSMSWMFTSADTSVTTTFTLANTLGSGTCWGGGSGRPYLCRADFQIPTHMSNHGPFLGSLTVNLNGKLTQTYNFQYMIPYPEPTTFLLFGTGLAGIGWRKFRAIGKANR